MTLRPIAYARAKLLVDLAIFVAFASVVSAAFLGDARAYWIDQEGDSTRALLVTFEETPIGGSSVSSWGEVGTRFFRNTNPWRPIVLLSALIIVRILGGRYLAPPDLRSASRWMLAALSIPLIGIGLVVTVGPAEPRGLLLLPAPEAGTSVLLMHPHFGESRWILRLPEYAYTDPRTGTHCVARNVLWEFDPGGRRARFQWVAEEAWKYTIGQDFLGEVTVVDDDRVDFHLSVRNLGSTSTVPVQSLICLRSGRVEGFVDPDAERTFVRKQGRFVSVAELIGEEGLPEHRMTAFLTGDGVDNLAAKVDADGGWVLGISVEPAASLSFNSSPSLSCMHSNARWSAIEPGEEATVHGTILLMPGSLDDLWMRHVSR